MCCIGSGDCFGGVGSPMNTPMNTLGVGDMVPAGQHTLGNDFCQQPSGRRQRKNITSIIMSPRPLYVPTGGPRRKR